MWEIIFTKISHTFLLELIKSDKVMHCIKRVRIGSYSDPHFSAFFHIQTEYGEIRRDTEYLSVFSPNTGKCGENADQKNSEYGLFLRSDAFFLRFTADNFIVKFNFVSFNCSCICDFIYLR